MYCVVAVAGNGEELWVYGSYVNKIAASDFAEKMQARYPEIEYVVAELLDPGQAGRRSDGYLSRSNEAATKPDGEMCKAAIESDGTDVFVVYNGVRIAKRGQPGTPQDQTWVSLEPGYTVWDKGYPQELVVEYEGKAGQS